MAEHRPIAMRYLLLKAEWMCNMANTGDMEIVVDYYEGAYGPTIRINTRAIESVVNIRQAFLKLGNSEFHDMEFHEVVAVKSTNVKGLIMKLVPQSEDQSKTLVLTNTTPEGPIFCWSMTSAGWLECAGLLEGIIKLGRPSHQYLTREGIDEALIELAFKEA